MMAFGCVRGTCPAYFPDMCVPVDTVAGRAKLRSACHGDLIVPSTKIKTFGSQRFCSAVPTTWNNLSLTFMTGMFVEGNSQAGLKRGCFAVHCSWEVIPRIFYSSDALKITDWLIENDYFKSTCSVAFLPVIDHHKTLTVRLLQLEHRRITKVSK